MNKRQQVRNERTLQELIKSVPGNDKCADCGARNPGWASWSLGVFLCLRCAALHRKLGTHISKVKSLSMDQWNVEQVENMKRMGNTASNRIYNPRNAKPSIPIDVDEVDGVMERFIRQKYESKTLSSESPPSSRHHTGSTSSDDRPATLPPKPAKRFHFGLRSASSTLPHPRSDKASPPMSPTGLGGFGRDPSPPRNKPAKVFGADIGGSRDDNYKMKLIQLKEMGFPDEKKNLAILKGLNGNIDRAVEELVRLGEGSRRSSRTTTPAPRNGVNGISIEKTRPPAVNGKTATHFDAADTSKSLPPLPTSSPVLQQPTSQVTPQVVEPPNSYNPFLQPQQSLNQSAQGLQIAQQTQHIQPPQQLFPNTTGGYGSQPHAHNPFLQTYTPPPIPTSSSPSSPSSTSFQQNQFTAPAPFPFQPQPTGSDALNPFLRPSRSQAFNSTNPFENQVVMASPPVQQSTQSFTYEPFSQALQPPQVQVQSQSQPTFQTQYPQPSTYPPPTQPQPSNYNPFQQSASSQQPQHIFQQPLVQSPQAEQPIQFPPQAAQPRPEQSLYQQPFSNSTFPILQQQQLLPPQQSHHQSSFPPIRYDKSSILALYNAPHPAAASALPTSSTPVAAAELNQAPKRSVTMPVTTIAGPADASVPPGSHNPFAAAAAPQQQAQGPATNGFRHGSNESVDFAGFASGRHSPDAFAGLSARVSTPRFR